MQTNWTRASSVQPGSKIPQLRIVCPIPQSAVSAERALLFAEDRQSVSNQALADHFVIEVAQAHGEHRFIE
jgi:hypothetical protein